MRAFIIFICVIIFISIITFTAFTFAYPIKHKSTIKHHAHEYNLNPILIAAVIHTESKFKTNVQSNKGAVGLMQLLPSTAEFIAKKNNITEYELLSAKDNIRLGTLYLKYLHDRFEDERIALAAYNAGEGNVAKWLVTDPELTDIPFRETRDYIKRVNRAKKVYKFRI